MAHVRGAGAGAPLRLIACIYMQVLLTNDDGIEAAGLQTLRRALVKVPVGRSLA